MKHLFTLLAILSLSALQAQDAKIITANTLEPLPEELTRSAFKYPSFLPGRIVFKDDAFADCHLNLNRLFSQVFFIRPKGDTLVLAHPETTVMVIISTDTFYYHQKNFMQKMTHHGDGVNLLKVQNLKQIGTEKKGAYGTYSPTTSVNSNSTFTPDNNVTQNISIDENMIFKLGSAFYLADRFNNIFPANKARFYKLFPAKEKEIRAFIDEHKINFNKEGDIQKLLQYSLSI